jgi:hypothetical protein
LQSKPAIGKRSPALEQLENRSLLSAATPWPNPAHLSLSFAPDGTQVAGQSSALFETLEAPMPEPEWQREILRAFQAWAEMADFNISVVADSGDPIGTPGQMQGDPRFGDIRIAAVQMPLDVISLSVRPSPRVGGTWSGDILINSSYNFDGTDADLYAVMLHEAGHALGVAHSGDPASVMFSHSNSTTTLSAGDRAAIQTIYGARSPDRFESISDSLAAATRLEVREKGATPVAIFGDITTASDIDLFSVRVPENYRGPATFRLRTDGVSLLAPRLTIYDSSGRSISHSESLGSYGGALVIQIPQVLSNSKYFAKVESAGDGAFSVGTYGLVVTFDNVSAIRPELIDVVLRGPYQHTAPEELGRMMLDPSRLDELLDDDSDGPDRDDDADHEPDEMGDARQTVSTDGVPVRGVLDQAVPETIHSLLIAQPQLFLLTVSLTPGDSRSIALEGTILDEQGHLIASLNLPAGERAASSTLFLKPGLYSIAVISVPSVQSEAAFSVAYTLHGRTISDPIGPRTTDPTVRPAYSCPGTPGVFCYPGTAPTPRPSLITPPRSRW